MAPEVASDPTVAGAMQGLSALRLLAHHLQGLPEVTLSLDVSDWREMKPALRIQLHQQSDGAEVARLADSLGLLSPVCLRDNRTAHWSAVGAWRGYEIRIITVIYADHTEEQDA